MEALQALVLIELTFGVRKGKTAMTKFATFLEY